MTDSPLPQTRTPHFVGQHPLSAVKIENAAEPLHRCRNSVSRFFKAQVRHEKNDTTEDFIYYAQSSYSLGLVCLQHRVFCAQSLIWSTRHHETPPAFLNHLTLLTLVSDPVLSLSHSKILENRIRECNVFVCLGR